MDPNKSLDLDKLLIRWQKLMARLAWLVLPTANIEVEELAVTVKESKILMEKVPFLTNAQENLSV